MLLENQSIQINSIINHTRFKACENSRERISERQMKFHCNPSFLASYSRFKKKKKENFILQNTLQLSFLRNPSLIHSRYDMLSLLLILCGILLQHLTFCLILIICSFINPLPSCGEWKFLNGRESAATLPGPISQQPGKLSSTPHITQMVKGGHFLLSFQISKVVYLFLKLKHHLFWSES